MANAVAKTDNTSKFDSLPVIVQLLVGILMLALVAVAGFAVFFIIDILLLDADPIGNAIAGIAHALGK